MHDHNIRLSLLNSYLNTTLTLKIPENCSFLPLFGFYSLRRIETNFYNVANTLVFNSVFVFDKRQNFYSFLYTSQDIHLESSLVYKCLKFGMFHTQGTPFSV